MPESVTDRCTKAHEYVFLLTKSERYFYDADAIKERAVSDHAPGNTSHKAATAYENGASEHRTKAGLVGFADRARNRRPQLRRALELAEEHGLTEAHIEAIRSGGITDTGKATVTQDGTGKNAEEIQRLMGEAKAALGGYYREFLIPDTRNKRSVWTIPTTPCKEAHFAVFPEELPRLCILAGSPEGGTVLDPFAGSGTTGSGGRETGASRGSDRAEPRLHPPHRKAAERGHEALGSLCGGVVVTLQAEREREPDPFLDERAPGSFFDADREREIRAMRQAYRLGDIPRAVPSQELDIAMRAVELLLEEVDRLRGGVEPGIAAGYASTSTGRRRRGWRTFRGRCGPCGPCSSATSN